MQHMTAILSCTVQGYSSGAFKGSALCRVIANACCGSYKHDAMSLM